jgi:hypothetical protein
VRTSPILLYQQLFDLNHFPFHAFRTTGDVDAGQSEHHLVNGFFYFLWQHGLLID